MSSADRSLSVSSVSVLFGVYTLLFLLCFFVLFLFSTPGSLLRDVQNSLLVDHLTFSGGSGRTLVIGDVHGCFKELQQLIKSSHYRMDYDQLVFVGDMVGKGPFTVEVIQFAMDHEALCTRGNHEDILISWYLAKDEKPELYPSYLEIAEKLNHDQWNYLLSCPYVLPLEHVGAVVVHAGYDQRVKLEEQDKNLLMNMRNIKNGEFTAKADIGSPWIDTWEGPELVLFGHDAKKGLQLKYTPQEELIAVGLDTGVVYGGMLSAIALPDQKIIQVQAKKVYKEP